MHQRIRIFTGIAMVAVVSLVGVSCGGDDDDGSASAGTARPSISDDAQPYVDAMRTSLSGADDGVDLTDSQIDCLAPRFVDTIGVERLEAHDVTTDDLAESGTMEFPDVDLTEEDGNRLYDSFDECGVNLKDMLMEDLDAGGNFSYATRDCMDEVLTEATLRSLMVTVLVKGDGALENDPALAPLTDRVMECAAMSTGDPGAAEG